MNAPDSSVIAMLRCPVTHTSMRLMSDEQIQELNARIGEGSVHDRQGTPVLTPFKTALINSEDTFAYAVRGQIIQLIAGQAIDLNSKL